jgi:hypothetical protein
MFRTADPQILGAEVQNLVTWRPGFEQSRFLAVQITRFIMYFLPPFCYKKLKLYVRNPTHVKLLLIGKVTAKKKKLKFRHTTYPM